MLKHYLVTERQESLGVKKENVFHSNSGHAGLNFLGRFGLHVGKDN